MWGPLCHSVGTNVPPRDQRWLRNAQGSEGAGVAVGDGNNFVFRCWGSAGTESRRWRPGCVPRRLPGLCPHRPATRSGDAGFGTCLSQPGSRPRYGAAGRPRLGNGPQCSGFRADTELRASPRVCSPVPRAKPVGGGRDSVDPVHRSSARYPAASGAERLGDAVCGGVGEADFVVELRGPKAQRFVPGTSSGAGWEMSGAKRSS